MIDDQNNSARDAAQSELFRHAALGDEDKDRTLTLSELHDETTTLNLVDLIEYDRDSTILPDDASLTERMDED